MRVDVVQSLLGAIPTDVPGARAVLAAARGVTKDAEALAGSRRVLVLDGKELAWLVAATATTFAERD